MPRTFPSPIRTTCASISPPISRPSRWVRWSRTSSPRCRKASSAPSPFLVDLNAQPAAARSAISSAWKPACRTPEETLSLASGSCRDSAWLLVQVARHLGLAARFVSGYLIQLKADVDPLEGPKGTDKDFCDLHAWTEIYIPGAGWIGLDVTSGLLCGEGHIPLAATPHYHSAAPITGTVDPANCEFRLRHAGRPHPRGAARHRPFSDDAWEKLDALGDAVDRDLVANDVRLTMGGEPTFVSIDDFEGAEWNTAAVGPTKRALADDLIRRLRDTFRAQRLSALRAGQVVSGRKPAALGLRALLAQGRPADLGRSRADRAGSGPARRRRSSRRRNSPSTSPTRLGVGDDFALPAFEDPTHWVLKEARTAGECRPVRSEDRRSGNARAHGAHLRARPVEAVRLRAADPALECAGERSPLEEREMEAATRQAVSGAGRFARSAFGCRSVRCPGCRNRIIPTSIRRTRPSRARRCRRTSNSRRSITRAAARPKPMPIARPASSRLRSRARCAPRCRSSRATACSACSCRRWRGSRIISNCSPRSSKRRARPARRSISKAIRRRTIRA